ncbi:MAG: NADPH:quinone oxidoreductase family protein [Acidimicrobiales bacterium]|nr:NADPH:quinone oxidoreductase family protein [Acidimicrobiales bacterium]
MRAAVCPAYGPPDVVVVRDVPVPEVETGHVRVQVEAAAVNMPDVLIVADRYQLHVPPPFVPGSEFAGTVTEVADDVRDVRVGDQVTATTVVGAFAEQAVVPRSSVRPVPDGVDLRIAAAFGVAYQTAYHVLRSVAAVEPGDELIVLGAGGGVGSAAVQTGAVLGAAVTAVASTPEKLDVASQLGATRLIDHRAEDLREQLREVLPDGADAVIDPVGGPLAEPALRSLHYGGRFVTVGYASGEIPRIPLNLVLLKGVEILGFQLIDFATHRHDELVRNDAELTALLTEGRVTPHIGATFPLDATAEALAHVAEGKAIGKVVIAVRA